MQFVVMIKTTPQAGLAEPAPTEDLRTAWADLYRDMTEQGVLVAGGGLAPRDAGARVSITQDEVIVMDAPFAATKEVIASLWVLQVASLEEALTWVRRIPTSARNPLQIDVRSVTEDDNPSDTADHGRNPTGQARPETHADQHQ